MNDWSDITFLYSLFKKLNHPREISKMSPNIVYDDDEDDDWRS